MKLPSWIYCIKNNTEILSGRNAEIGFRNTNSMPKSIAQFQARDHKVMDSGKSLIREMRRGATNETEGLGCASLKKHIE